VGAPVEVQGRHATAFVGGYVSGVEADGYQWLYGERMAGGIIPTDHDEVCAWVGVPSHRFGAYRRRPDLGFDELFEELAPDWRARLRAGTQHGPMRGFAGIPGFLRRAWGPGWALVGDAGYFKDPLSTHGMTDALRDAELLTEALVDGAYTSTSVDETAALARYQQRRDALSLDLFTVVDQVAGGWSLPELPGLLRQLSRAMRAEVDHLLQRDLATTAA
jgi:flavin-dependent dehydrogenase